ncbi:MAG TPA: TlpA disulfide reductase family protein [Acidimicrobiales bacterium]|nr:TlpA disulfide reductase family protein [Acidimicrobiales bacterium]
MIGEIDLEEGAGGPPGADGPSSPPRPRSVEGSGEDGPDSEAPRRGRFRWIVGGVVVALAAVAATVAFSGPSTTSAPTTAGGGKARAFELENLRKGQPVVSLAALRGKPVVLNFWASWCIPCRREMPGFQAVAQKLKGRVAFVGINHQDSRRAGLELLEETGVSYPSGYDPKGSVAAAYGLFGMPTTLFISPGGEILGRRSGEMSRKDLEETIDGLFLANGTSKTGQRRVR